MDFLGIGPLELFFILVIALIVLGPSDMVKTGRTIGRTLRKIVTSPNWRTVQQASHEIRHLPNRLMKEAGLEDVKKELDPAAIKQDLGMDEINKELRDIGQDMAEWTTPPSIPLTGEELKKQMLPKYPSKLSEKQSDSTELP